MKMNSVFVFLFFLCLFFTSCSRVNETEVGDTVLVLLSSESMEIPSEGCDTSILYEATKYSDITVSVESGQDWITDVNSEVEGVISFSVAANPSAQKRYGKISVSCPGADEALGVEIVQLWNSKDDDLPDGVSNEDFSIEIVDLTAISVTAHVTPVEADMRYITMIRKQEQMDMMSDDEAVFRNDLQYFESYSQASFLPMSEVINLFSAVGEKDIKLYGLDQGQNYCFYVYGITSEAERTTDICRMNFTTDVIEYLDVDFTIDVSLEGFTAYADITASDPSVPFYFDLKDGALFRNGDPDEIVSGLISDLFAEYAAYGFSAEYVIERLASFGSDSYVFGNLQPLTEYVIYAAALDYDGMVVSKAACKYFTTDMAGDASRLTVDFRISDVSARGAYVEAYPSDKTVKYFWDVVPEGTTADQVKQMISNTANVYIEQGSASDFKDFMAHVLAVRGDGAYRYETLDGNTEYVTYAFGITEDGFYATDIMFGDKFTTLPQRVSDASVEVSYDKYFDSEEVASVYPQFPGISGMAIVPSVVTVNSSAVGYYYAVSHGNLTDTEKYPDDMIIDQLITDGTTEPMPYWLSYGDITYLAIAYDKDGNYGELYRSMHTLTREDASPVSEFDPAVMSPAPQMSICCQDNDGMTINKTIIASKQSNEKSKIIK